MEFGDAGVGASNIRLILFQPEASGLSAGFKQDEALILALFIDYNESYSKNPRMLQCTFFLKFGK